MPNRLIPYAKAFLHVCCLTPFLYLLQRYHSGALERETDPVATVTHFTGNCTLWLLLIALAITPLRRLHPALASLIRFRRMVGLYAFFYASLHLATYVFLFSGYDLPSAWFGLKHGRLGVPWKQWVTVWPSVLGDVKDRPFLQVGLIAWLLLLALALTSPLFMLRRLGGKTWQRLHRLVYLAAILGCIHYWWLVKSGVLAPLPATLVLAALLVARIMWLMRKRRTTASAKAV